MQRKVPAAPHTSFHSQAIPKNVLGGALQGRSPPFLTNLFSLRKPHESSYPGKLVLKAAVSVVGSEKPYVPPKAEH